ncbi:uncharacterized protein V1513DRAFT_438191 [Lipomyces chichibuensis]|uniref:uncharacterized protein n=1 Tax=Lipomyces chichibuensis TaxID=1546026 RepID=UPI003344200F
MERFDQNDTITVSDNMAALRPKIEVSDGSSSLFVLATSSSSERNLTRTTAESFVDLVDYDDFLALYPERDMGHDEFDWCFMSMVSAMPVSQAMSSFAVGSDNSFSNKEFQHDQGVHHSATDLIAVEQGQQMETESSLLRTGVDYTSQRSEIDPSLGVLSPANSDPESQTSQNVNVHASPTRVSALDEERLLLTPNASPNHHISASISPASQVLQEAPMVKGIVREYLQHNIRWTPIGFTVCRNKPPTTANSTSKGQSKNISFNKRADAHPLLLRGDRLSQFLSVEYPSQLDVDKWAHLVICHDSGPCYPSYCKLFGDVFGNCPLDFQFEKHIASLSRYYVVDMSDVDDYFTDEDLRGPTSPTDGKPISALSRSFMDFTLAYLFPDGNKKLDILISPIPYLVVRSNCKGPGVGRAGQPLGELPKRPLNVHRLFATAALHQVMRNSARADTRMVNTAKIQSAIAMIWHRVPPKLKSLFILMQKESAALHSSIFPDYKYCPNRSKRKRRDDAIDNEK